MRPPPIVLLLVPVLLASLLPGCGRDVRAPERLAPEEPDDDAWAAPPLDRACRAFDGRSGEEIDLEELADRLAEADVVFLGESHLDETTHRLQRHLLAGLIERRDGAVVLAMEQFERDVQAALDEYLAGAIDEAAFRARARPWPNYETDYRPLVELAREHGVRVVASNVPRTLARKVATGGQEAYGALTAEERPWIAATLHPHSLTYWKRVDNAIRGHAAMAPPGGSGVGAAADPQDPAERVHSTQSLWDNTMAESIVRAREASPDALVVHVNGGFHSAWFDGTVAQLAKRDPELRVATVAMEPASDVALVEPPSGEPVLADFVVAVAAIASSRDGDRFTVRASREHTYLFRRPRDVTRPPLLVLLPQEGVSAEETLGLARQVVGSEAAIAVLDPSWPRPEDDLAEGGRFFAGDPSSDLFLAAQAAEGAASWLLRNHDLDAERVVLAGEGEGATAAAGIVLHSGEPFTGGLAVAPRSYRFLGDVPLPVIDDPAERARERSALAVLAEPADVEWWRGEVAQWAETRTDATVAEAPPDPWAGALDAENALRRALGLAERADPGRRVHVVVPDETPRARAWALRFARRMAPDALVAVLGSDEAASDGPLADLLARSTALPLPSGVGDAAQPGALPLASGPFGGTTVLVVLDDAPEDVRAAWHALEADDPIAKANRFHRLRVADVTGERGLRAVLEKLRSEGRRNVLIVPAVFHAGTDTMRRLAAECTGLGEGATLRWLPGLGAPLPGEALRD